MPPRGFKNICINLIDWNEKGEQTQCHRKNKNALIQVATALHLPRVSIAARTVGTRQRKDWLSVTADMPAVANRKDGYVL
jgi:hypothetical protein